MPRGHGRRWPPDEARDDEHRREAALRHAGLAAVQAQTAQRLPRSSQGRRAPAPPTSPRPPQRPANTPLKLIGTALLVAPPRCGDAAKPRQQLSGTLAGPRRCRHPRWCTPRKTASSKPRPPRVRPTWPAPWFGPHPCGSRPPIRARLPRAAPGALRPADEGSDRRSLFPHRRLRPGAVHRVPAHLPEPPALSHRAPVILSDDPAFLRAARRNPRSTVSSNRGDPGPQIRRSEARLPTLSRGVGSQGAPSSRFTATTRSLRR